MPEFKEPNIPSYDPRRTMIEDKSSHDTSNDFLRSEPSIPDVGSSFDFDVEDLVKKIDAKIAQLEEEERKK